jgi:uncharacterized OB-fold protein
LQNGRTRIQGIRSGKENVKMSKNRGKYIGYSGEKCTNCGRVRVEAWEDGSKICEKCNWNQDAKEYESNKDGEYDNTDLYLKERQVEK